MDRTREGNTEKNEERERRRQGQRSKEGKREGNPHPHISKVQREFTLKS